MSDPALAAEKTGFLGMNRSGRSLLYSTFINNLGNAMHIIAMGKLLYDRTGSAGALGLILVVDQALTFGVHLVAGPFIDQKDPRVTYVRFEYVRGFIVTALALMMSEGNALPWLLGMSLMIQMGKPVNRAATFMLPPAVIPEPKLNRFNGYSNMFQQGGALIGMLLAGLILDRASAKIVFLINGLTFIASAFLIQRVAYYHDEIVQAGFPEGIFRRVKHLVLTSWLEIVQMLRGNLSLFWHLLITSADFVSLSIFTLLLPSIASNRFGNSPYWISYLDAAFTLGAIIGAPLADRAEKTLKPVYAAFIGIAGQSIAYALFANATSGTLSLLVAFGIGISNTISWAALVTALQIRAPKAMRARISTLRHIFVAIVTAGLIPIVTRAEAFSLNRAFLVSGGIFAGFALLLLLLSSRTFFGMALFGKPRN